MFSDNQIVAFLAAAPFLTLAIAWLIGVACMTPKAVPVRAKRRHRSF